MKRAIVILLHVGYWLLYLLLLLLIFLFFRSGMGGRGTVIHLFDSRFLLLITAFAVIPAIGGFYLFYTFLFRLLKQKKVLLFFAAALVTAIGCGLTGLVCLIFMVPRISLFADGFNSAIPITVIMSLLALLNGGTGLVIKGFISWYGDIKIKDELNRRNFETELALVKAQINPHFLFNTINNIDVLIGLDAAKASAYLNKLSDIMRFMLYETKTEKIPLAKELEYIEKYIDLQKIRSFNPDYVHYSVDGDAGDWLIEPMLLIPFIENAFKHSVNHSSGNIISIRIAVDDKKLLFECENNYLPSTATTNIHGGLGDGLAKKRLLLLYPGKHELAVTKNEAVYKVKLCVYHHEN